MELHEAVKAVVASAVATVVVLAKKKWTQFNCEAKHWNGSHWRWSENNNFFFSLIFLCISAIVESGADIKMV